MSEDFKKERGSLWASHSASGNAEVKDEKYHVDVVRTGLEGNKPSHRIYMRAYSNDNAACNCCVLFRDKEFGKEGKSRLASGRIELEGVEYWVNLYKNDKEGRAANYPDLGLTFRESEPKPEPAAAEHSEGNSSDLW